MSASSPTSTRSNATSTNHDDLFTVLADLPQDSAEAIECRTALIESYLPRASRLARRFRNRGPSTDDLIQVARLGLVGAVERFEPQRGVDFAPYAITTILGELKRYFRDTTWAIRVPRLLQEQNLMISAASADFSQQTGRVPTPTELSTVLSLSVKDVQAALHAGAAYRALSLDAPRDTPGHVAEDYLRQETTGISSDDWVPVVAAVRGLPERDRQVIYLRFFEDLSQSDIAQQIGVSQMQVSRILTRTLKVLHDELVAA
jgi:RNA polymerase sigma-B factor